jgi:hypothetical protein
MNENIKARRLESAKIKFKERLENDEYREAYYYILGQYLGDGCVSKYARTYRLRIFASITHLGIIDEVTKCLKMIFPSNSIGFSRKPGCLEISVYSNMIPIMFPHIGDGRKHDRKIELSEFQKQHIQNGARFLLRGLFHSDGCYYRQRILRDGSEIMNYSFCNKSKDIHAIYQMALEICGIGYSYHRKTKDDDSISITGIYKKTDVDAAFSIMGSKY